MDKESLLNELWEDFNYFTHILKNMNPSNPEYPKIWDQRVDVRRAISEIEKS